MQTEEPASAEAAPAEEPAAAMDTQAEVNKTPQHLVSISVVKPSISANYVSFPFVVPGRSSSCNGLEPALRADV